MTKQEQKRYDRMLDDVAHGLFLNLNTSKMNPRNI